MMEGLPGRSGKIESPDRKDSHMDLSFYNGKKVLLTGHTGFKGSWMSVALVNAGAEVIGYSSCSKEETRLFDLCGIKDQIIHIKGDVRDLEHLKEIFKSYQPVIVIHMAAQPIVRTSYLDPVGTYDTNVMGTVNILECVRLNPCVRSFLNVTTDKVYENKEWEWGYRENEPLDGFDPYSNSKSCSELVTHSYKNSFFSDNRTAISTARAGNVIGGGDFAKDRIIPDCVRAALKGENIIVRNPFSTRPYQHVLEPVCAYLMIAAKQYEDSAFAGYYNVGPDDRDCFETGKLVDMFVRYWGNGLKWVNQYDGGPHEANYLKLDCSKLKVSFGWQPKWNLETAVQKVIEWTKCWSSGGDIRDCMNKQINAYLAI
jgi:CDP-glucose 4,6-dehydratase